MSPAESERRAVTRRPPVGFRAQLEGASLWDLVQMECLARSRLVVRVTGEGGVGYLYFAEGRVVHAVTSKLRRGGGAGDPRLDQRFVSAVRSCLAGRVHDRDSYEGLILRLAKRRDEGSGQSRRLSRRGGASGTGGSAASR